MPVTSRDVLFTLHAILDPRNPVRSHEGYELIDRAAARGDDTVVLHLRHAWAPAVVTYFSYGFCRSSYCRRTCWPAQARWRSRRSAPHRLATGRTVCCGGIAAKVCDTLRIRYWRGTPHAGLDVRIAPDPSTNLVMLQSAQLDWNLIAPSQLTTLRGNDRLAFLRAPSAVVAGLAFNTRERRSTMPAMRRAVAMSIDRGAISRKITLGYYPVTNAIQPQFSWAYDPSIRQPAYDPAGADRFSRRPAGIATPRHITKNGRRVRGAVRAVSGIEHGRARRGGRASGVARARH